MTDSNALSPTTPTLISLGCSRPRPRRNHKPSTPSALSPTSLPSLFEDDQLTFFFPSIPPTHISDDLTQAPSSTPSALKNKESNCYRCPSLQPTDEKNIAPVEGVETTTEEAGCGSEAERKGGREGEEGARIAEKTGGGGDETKMMKEEEKEKNKGWKDGTMKEDKGRNDWEKKDEEEYINIRKKEEEEVKEEKEDYTKRKEENVATGPPPYNDKGDVFEALEEEQDKEEEDNDCTDVSTDPAILTRTSNNSLNLPQPPSPIQLAGIPQRRRSSYSTCLTPDSVLDSSYTTDNATSTEILSSPQSAGCEDDDLNLKFVFPPKISRLGSIYSHLGLSHSSGESSSSDSEGETLESPPKQESLSKASRKYNEKGGDGKRECPTEVEEGMDGVAVSVTSRSKVNSLERCERPKKIPPAKPPRLRASVRVNNNNNSNKRRSREDPVRYKTVNEDKGISSKRSISMNNILESNPEEPVEEACSRLSAGSPEKAATGSLLQPPAEHQGMKRNHVGRISTKYRDATKAVNAVISKKPLLGQFFNRKEASRFKNQSPRKMQCPEEQAPSAPSSAQSPVSALSLPSASAEDQKQKDSAPEVNKPPKPPRKDLDTITPGSLDNSQTTCSAHGALLNFYCVKCRVVVCRDCTVVAHSHADHHKVLDTLDSIAMLRSEVVAMLRHYTILESMHASLMDIYKRFIVQNRDIDITAIGKRLDEGKYLGEVVKEAEQIVMSGTNLHYIQELVKQWEARQEEWGDLVFLASRCALLTDMHIPFDTVLLRMGSWVMPTPWIQLSHLLQPYLRPSTPSPASSSSSSCGRDDQATPHSRRKALELPTSLRVQRRSGSPYGGRTNTGGTDQPFPHNARQVVLSNLVPYIILNPDIRYFVHVGGPRDVNLTLVVVPADDHARDYMKKRRNNATMSPEVLRQANYRPPTDAIKVVEQQMTCGSCKTRITASSLGSSSTPSIVKVSFSDVKITADGHGLPTTKGGVKRGDVIIDQTSNGRPTLTVVLQDIGEFPALRVGQVTWGMDGLTCLVGTDDTKRVESGGFRAKIKATVKREEEAVYDVMFGMDL